MATSSAWRVLYTNLQGLNKCSNLLRKDLSGPPPALRSEDLWDKASIHLLPRHVPVNSYLNGNRIQQDNVAVLSLGSEEEGGLQGRGGGGGGGGHSFLPLVVPQPCESPSLTASEAGV